MTDVLLVLRDVPEGASERSWTRSANALDISDPAVRIPGPVQVLASIERTGERLLVDLRIEGEIRSECARCLGPVRFDGRGRSRFNFDARHEVDHPLWRAKDEALDLGAEARELLLLEFPSKLLCSEDCRGLCPACGANRNERPCECESSSADPRWNALKTLVDRADGAGSEPAGDLP